MKAILAIAVAVAISGCSGGGAKDVPRAAPAPAPVADVVVAPPPAPMPVDLEPAPVDDRADGGTVTIKLVADGRRQAHVTWGRKDLGVAPLEIVRPRGSAPLDLTIQAPGFLPLHTRVFTDRDDTLSLRLYSEGEAVGLPGYAPPAPAPSPSATKK
jgi:hypothetical protein